MFTTIIWILAGRSAHQRKINWQLISGEKKWKPTLTLFLQMIILYYLITICKAFSIVHICKIKLIEHTFCQQKVVFMILKADVRLNNNGKIVMHIRN